MQEWPAERRNACISFKQLLSARCFWAGMRKLLEEGMAASPIQIIFVTDTSGCALWWLSSPTQNLGCACKSQLAFFKKEMVVTKLCHCYLCPNNAGGRDGES